jgi:hypothetical protein
VEKQMQGKITQAMLAAISQAAELPECKPDRLDVHGANQLDALFFRRLSDVRQFR